MRIIPALEAIPPEVGLELIPVQYLGGPYPGIGLYSTACVETDEELWELANRITEKLNSQAELLGMASLVELSSAEDIRWQDVLNAFTEADPSGGA